MHNLRSVVVGQGRICINLNHNRGFRRGEGGWVDGWWAFTVARCGLPEDIGSSLDGPLPPTHGRP